MAIPDRQSFLMDDSLLSLSKGSGKSDNSDLNKEATKIMSCSARKF